MLIYSCRQHKCFKNTMEMRNITSSFWHRPGGDRGGGADGAATGAAEPGCSQNLFCEGATCAAGSRPRLTLTSFLLSLPCTHRPRGHSSVLSDLQSFPAAARWQARADSFHGNGQQATDTALAHRLPSGILTQNPGTIGTTFKKNKN